MAFSSSISAVKRKLKPSRCNCPRPQLKLLRQAWPTPPWGQLRSAVISTPCLSVRVMTLITPAMASVPYKDDAPSLKTSMRSTAAKGRLSKSTWATSVPEMFWIPNGANLRPLSNTNVPVGMPCKAPLLNPPSKLPLCVRSTELNTWVRLCTTWVTDRCPFLSISWRVITRTGKASVCSLRTIDDPVISTFSNCRYSSGFSTTCTGG